MRKRGEGRKSLGHEEYGFLQEKSERGGDEEKKEARKSALDRKENSPTG